MLNKYWNSPALALTIRPSATRRKLFFLLALTLGWSNVLVALSAYPLWVGLMIVPSVLCLWQLYTEPYCDASLGWRDGHWLFIHREKFTAAELRPGWVCLPLVIRLTLQEPTSGRRYSLMLFHDSAEEEALRRLRRRLRLER